MTAKRILVIYYSQTGQLKRIIDSVLAPLIAAGCEVKYAEIRPVPVFHFPWSSAQFFDTFPESLSGIPCAIEKLDIEITGQYDLIVFGYSPWYLSPSMPAHAFLQSDTAALLLNGKPVVTIIGCRNMWLMAQEKIKKYMRQLNANIAGNIVLCDRSANLVSVVTIIRWLMQGKKEKTGFFPAAGVSQEDIESAVRFGKPILEALEKSDYEGLQKELNQMGSVVVKPNLLLFERNGSRIFRMWATKILRRGPFGDRRRKTMLRFFKYYLLMVLFVISPLASAVYAVIKIFVSKKIKKDIQYFSQNSLPDIN